MIFDTLDNWKRYFRGPVWDSVHAFLVSLDAETEEGEYEIRGRDVFARVITYETKAETEAILETHREYIDIQIALDKAERVGWLPVEGLEGEPYNPETDATFYRYPGRLDAEALLRPGFFVALFPSDAHMPGLITEKAHVMKKAVVKVKVGLADYC